MIRLALALFLLASPAASHGRYAWIMENPETMHCCGPRDCRVVDDSDYGYWDKDWHVHGRVVKDVYASQDRQGRAWACFVQPENVVPRCLFIPTLM